MLVNSEVNAFIVFCCIDFIPYGSLLTLIKMELKIFVQGKHFILVDVVAKFRKLLRHLRVIINRRNDFRVDRVLSDV
jgi:hypothetical protein